MTRIEMQRIAEIPDQQPKPSEITVTGEFSIDGEILFSPDPKNPRISRLRRVPEGPVFEFTSISGKKVTAWQINRDYDPDLTGGKHVL